MTLYEMTAAQKELYELMTSGEIDGEVYADTLEGIGIPEKIEGYCVVENELAGDLDAMFSGYSIGEHAKLSYEDSCYVITVDLADLPEMTDGLDFFGIGVSDSSDGTLMYKIDAESFLPAEIKLSNMTNVLTSQYDESMSYRVVLQASYDMFFSEWNSVSDDRVAVPDDVKSTATESVYSIDWGVTDER